MQNDAMLKLELSIDELNLVLDALGRLPFATVYTVIGRIQEQARAQLNKPAVRLEPGEGS